MPRLSWSWRKVCRSSPTPRQNDNSWSDTRGGSRMPELGPYGSVRGALSIRPPKHAASDNHRRSTTRRSSLSSNETPGVSAKRRASAARRWHSSIKWLLCSTVTSASLFFACSMISSPASARRRAPCLTAAPLKRRPRGIGVGDQKQSPVMRGSVRLRIQHTSHRHQPITSSPGHGARCPRLGDLATIRVTIG